MCLRVYYKAVAFLISKLYSNFSLIIKCSSIILKFIYVLQPNPFDHFESAFI